MKADTYARAGRLLQLKLFTFISQQLPLQDCSGFDAPQMGKYDLCYDHRGIAY
jgi:hypothetical protein